MTNATKQGIQETYDSDKLSIYDFTFDPEEEPPPTSKKSPKRKTTARKPNPKIVVLKDNYNKNLSKALANLKQIIKKNRKNDKVISADSNDEVKLLVEDETKNTKAIIINRTLGNGDQNKPDPLEVHKLSPRTPIHIHNKNLIRSTFENDTHKQQSSDCSLQPRPDDQLFLQNYQDFSFEEQPNASSSFLSSPRRPNATPWRLQWEAPATKWPVNMYVKSNMTPAYESNFSNVDEGNVSKKYPVDIEINTNHGNDTPKNIYEEPINLVQTSILSFIQEVVTKSTKKKHKVLSPAKHNSDLDNVTEISFGNSESNAQHHDHFFTPEKAEAVDKKPVKLTNKSHVPKVEKVKKCVLGNDKGPLKALSLIDQKIDQVPVKGKVLKSPEKTPQKRKHKDQSKTPNKRKKSDKYFRFEVDTDQENLSPIKEAAKPQVLRPRTGCVLKELNSQSKPLRIPEIINKSPDSPKQQDSPKQVDHPGENSDTNVRGLKAALHYTNPSNSLVKSTFAGEIMKQDQINDEVGNMSPVLFDDVDIVLHNKPVRKSYGKAVMPSECRVSTATSVQDWLDRNEQLGFVQPILREEVAKAKKKKVNKISKKEVEEADKWASSFNSMCEDIEEFDLIIE